MTPRLLIPRRPSADCDWPGSTYSNRQCVFVCSRFTLAAAHSFEKVPDRIHACPTCLILILCNRISATILLDQTSLRIPSTHPVAMTRNTSCLGAWRCGSCIVQFLPFAFSCHLFDDWAWSVHVTLKHCVTKISAGIWVSLLTWTSIILRPT